LERNRGDVKAGESQIKEGESLSSPVHPREITFEEGVFLVRLARRAVEVFLEKGARIQAPGDTPPKLLRPGAAFVTIETFLEENQRELRGCIGYIEPVKPLVDTVIDVAIEAAVHDPRFPPMSPVETSMVTFEVSILSEKEPLPSNPPERPGSIVIGRHGLIVEKGVHRGLLLPQVPVEYGWDEETFLAETCVKAGLHPTCWLDPETRFYRYEARIYREKKPRGEVEERDLSSEYKAWLQKRE
jgi:uncharacterized protein (TIGR00296 family)